MARLLLPLVGLAALLHTHVLAAGEPAAPSWLVGFVQQGGKAVVCGGAVIATRESPGSPTAVTIATAGHCLRSAENVTSAVFGAEDVSAACPCAFVDVTHREYRRADGSDIGFIDVLVPAQGYCGVRPTALEPAKGEVVPDVKKGPVEAVFWSKGRVVRVVIEPVVGPGCNQAIHNVETPELKIRGWCTPRPEDDPFLVEGSSGGPVIQSGTLVGVKSAHDITLAIVNHAAWPAQPALLLPPPVRLDLVAGLCAGGFASESCTLKVGGIPGTTREMLLAPQR